MNDKEIAEIRRRLRPEKNNIGRLRGCYVNDKRSIISEFDQNFGLISSDESEELLSLLRRTLTGSIGRNLIDVSFTNDQVLNGDEHKLLMKLRDSSLSDSEAVKTLYSKIAESLEIEGSYFILLANDKYDVFKFNANDDKDLDSGEVFSYFICAICPIKDSKPSLRYNISQNKFSNIIKDSIIGVPSLGFMFPSFDGRTANIYNAVFYTRDVSASYDSFADSVFKSFLPMPAADQATNVAELLHSTVSEKCDMELVQMVHGQLIELTTDHKNNKCEDPLLLTSKDVGSLLRCSGINEEKVIEFTEKFVNDFGNDAAIPPSNFIDIKKFEVTLPDVTIKVNPQKSELIETRIIDGTKYLLIRADNDIEVNGIKITINE